MKVQQPNRFFMYKSKIQGAKARFVIHANIDGKQVKLMAYPEVAEDDTVYYQGPVLPNDTEDTCNE